MVSRLTAWSISCNTAAPQRHHEEGIRCIPGATNRSTRSSRFFASLVKPVYTNSRCLASCAAGARVVVVTDTGNLAGHAANLTPGMSPPT